MYANRYIGTFALQEHYCNEDHHVLVDRCQHGESSALRTSLPQLIAIGSRQSAIGNRQSAIGNRQSAIGNRQSAIEDNVAAASCEVCRCFREAHWREVESAERRIQVKQVRASSDRG
jgi:hypothetical protein